MKALKLVTLALLLAAAGCTPTGTGGGQATDSTGKEGGKKEAGTKLKTNKYAIQMMHYYYDSLQLQDYRKFSVYRIPVGQLKALLKIAEENNVGDVSIILGAYSKTMLNSITEDAAGDPPPGGTTGAAGEGDAGGTVGDNTGDPGQCLITLDPGQPVPQLCVEVRPGVFNCPNLCIRKCPPPESCDLDSITGFTEARPEFEGPKPTK
jgi:hypothetical protein